MSLGSFPSGTDPTAAARTMARLAGCTCDPDVNLDPVPDRDGLRHIEVAHDDDCSLLARIERRN